MFRKPVHDVAVVTGDAQLISLRVADDILLRQPIMLTEVNAKLDCLFVNGRKICGVGKPVLAYLKTDVCVIGSAAAMPASHIPRQRLVGGDSAVLELTNESVDANLSTARTLDVPVVVVLVLAQQTVVGSDLPLEVGIVRAC